MESMYVQARNLVIFASLMMIERGRNNLRVLYPRTGKAEFSALPKGNV